MPGNASCASEEAIEQKAGRRKGPSMKVEDLSQVSGFESKLAEIDSVLLK